MTPRRQAAFAAAALALAALAAAGAEAALRARGRGRPDPFPYLMEHPDRFWTLRPGWSGPVPWGGELRVNAAGFRGPEDAAAPEGAAELWVLGDSSAFGWGVPYEATFGEGLARLLEEAGAAPRVRARNLSVPGYTSFQGRLLAESLPDSLRPRWAVVYYGQNDDNSGHDEILRFGRTGAARVLRDAEVLRLRRAAERGWIGGAERFLGGFALYALLRDGVAEARYLLLDRVLGVEAAERRASPEEFRENLRRIAALVRERGGRAALCSYPRTYEGEDFPRYAEAARRAAEEAGALYVDLAALLGADAALFADDVHPSALGHRRIAEALAAAFLSPIGEARAP